MIATRSSATHLGTSWQNLDFLHMRVNGVDKNLNMAVASPNDETILSIRSVMLKSYCGIFLDKGTLAMYVDLMTNFPLTPNKISKYEDEMMATTGPEVMR
jgi:hypothetical protein